MSLQISLMQYILRKKMYIQDLDMVIDRAIIVIRCGKII